MSAEAIFTALGEPVRRDLLETIAAQGPQTATELSRNFPITRQAILKHLNVLEGAALVTVQQQGRDKRYELSTAPLNELTAWVEAIGTRSEERLQRLKAMLESEE
ncbi:ArsR/SmtB family transcription factor [Aureibacillus halotolerans]|uniref:ArsR family transcriptional regulator n=1 Tax=Aureibacillus halotolerans TaxID=1508390 RepID=A0A4R6TTI9_9BACI|nr:helix-turn-helix transcriptional regulator [Aureibacillus halotolerans]TDQ36611.1 ArsR family transcriptional regulator [Aureibacillus halotolerans]